MIPVPSYSQATAPAQDAPVAPTKTVVISPSLEITQGILIKKVEPKYPGIAKAAGLERDVVLKATIGKDGRISNLYVVSGPELLKDAALKAAKKWVCKPYLLNGVPTELLITINVNFSLDKSGNKKN